MHRFLKDYVKPIFPPRVADLVGFEGEVYHVVECNEPINENQGLTPSQVADMIGIPQSVNDRPGAVLRLRREGKLVGYRASGQWLFHTDAVKQFMMTPEPQRFSEKAGRL